MGRRPQEVNLKLTKNLIYLTECLKVEGYWSLNNREGSIQNKNLNFLRRLETIAKKISLNISKRILIKIKLKESFLNTEIKIKNKEKEIKFYREKSVFGKSDKIVFFLRYKPNQKVKIYSSDNLIKTIEIRESLDEFIVEPFSIGYAYLELRFWSINFIKFLEEKGGNPKKPRINFELIKDKSDLKTSVLSGLIDSEGSVNYYQHYRKIRIRMSEKKYLLDVRKLLKSLGINSGFRKNNWSHHEEYQITISGWEDFNRLIESGLKLFHSHKQFMLSKIMGSYKRKLLSRGEAKSRYLEKVKNHGPVTIKELSKKMNKSERVVNHYLNKLVKENLIQVNKSKVLHVFSI